MFAVSPLLYPVLSIVTDEVSPSCVPAAVDDAANAATVDIEKQNTKIGTIANKTRGTDILVLFVFLQYI